MLYSNDWLSAKTLDTTYCRQYVVVYPAISGFSEREIEQKGAYKVLGHFQFIIDLKFLHIRRHELIHDINPPSLKPTTKESFSVFPPFRPETSHFPLSHGTPTQNRRVHRGIRCLIGRHKRLLLNRIQSVHNLVVVCLLFD